MDAIFDMLHGMRLTGSVFLEGEFSAPWCVLSQVGPEDYQPFTPPPRHVIAYHYVTAGRLLLKIDGQPPIEAGPGEILILPRNDPHVLGSSLDIRPVGVEHLINPGPDGGPARIVYGGGGERTVILCGYLGDETPHNPLIVMLPRVLKIGVADSTSGGRIGGWIESSFRLAAAESAEGLAGSPAFLARLAELLFLDAVRRYLAAQPPGDAWTAGMTDPTVARALGLLHSGMARRWTTDDLAREVGLSRSAFAERFTRAAGEPPMRYLARLRLSHACALLKETTGSIARIAYDVGYESEAAFSRAFRRQYGMPPAAWRSQ